MWDVFIPNIGRLDPGTVEVGFPLISHCQTLSLPRKLPAKLSTEKGRNVGKYSRPIECLGLFTMSFSIIASAFQISEPFTTIFHNTRRWLLGKIPIWVFFDYVSIRWLKAIRYNSSTKPFDDTCFGLKKHVLF